MSAAAARLWLCMNRGICSNGHPRAPVTAATARNRWILANCTSLVLCSLDSGGNLARLITTFPIADLTCLQR